VFVDSVGMCMLIEFLCLYVHVNRVGVSMYASIELCQHVCVNRVSVGMYASIELVLACACRFRVSVGMCVSI